MTPFHRPTPVAVPVAATRPETCPARLPGSVLRRTCALLVLPLVSAAAFAGVFYPDGSTTMHFAFEGSPNGDRGNILTLLRRAEWRGYDARAIELGRGSVKGDRKSVV